MSCLSSETSTSSSEARASSGLEEIIANNLCTIDELEAETFELNYRVGFSELMFYGDVKIHLKIKTTLSYIVLDKGSNYEVDNVTVKKGAVILEVDNVIDYPPADKLIIGLNRKLLPGSYMISMLTKGYLSNEPIGFYVINKEPDKKFALTQLAPNKTKLVFPCFEHPTFKSVFIINLVRPFEGFSALSNMKIDKIIIDYPTEKNATVKFLPTPPIPSYLVSMIVGTFKAGPPLASKFGYLLSVSARHDLLDKTFQVQRIAMSILNAHSKYLRRHYPLEKLDLVAVPFDSEPVTCQGNPGIVLFREFEIVALSQKTCKEFVSCMKRLLHELAHQWIGGVVTLNNWNDLWLCEGLAGLVTNVVGSMMYPRWYSDWVSQIFELHPALHLGAIDSSNSSQDDSLPPDLDSDIHFCDIYYKSTSILRMLWGIDFKSVRYSLNTMLSLKTTIEPDTMWNHLDTEMKINAKALLDSWKERDNYPLIVVCQTATCLPQIRQIPFTRKRISGSGIDSVSDNRHKWDIPIMYFNPVKPRKRNTVWLKKENEHLIIDDYRGKWIKLNWHQLGYYRVNYTKLMWSHFIHLFHSTAKAFDVEDVGNLIDDAFCLANYGHLSHDIPFSLVAYLKNGLETESVPWLLVSKHLERIYHRTIGTTVQKPLEKFFLVLLQNNISDDLWSVQNLPIGETLRKTEIINFAGWVGHGEIVEKMRSLLVDWFDSNEIAVELKQLVLEYGLSGRHNDEELWEEVLDHFDNETDPVKLNQLWTALTGVRNNEFVSRLIQNIICMDKEEADFDVACNSLTELGILSRNHLAAEMLWEKVRNDWPNISRFPSSLRKKVTDIFMNVCESIKDVSTLESIVNYGEENSDPDIVAYARYAIGDEERWSDDYSDYITEWLHHYVTNNIII